MQVFPVFIPHWSLTPAWENPLFCRHFVKVWTTLGGARGWDGSRGWVGPVEWGRSFVHTKHFMELGLDFLMDSKGFNVHLAAPHPYPAPVSFCILQNCRVTKILKLWERLCCTLSFWLHKPLGT